MINLKSANFGGFLFAKNKYFCQKGIAKMVDI